MSDLSQPPQPEQWQVPPPRVSQQRAARRLPALLFIAGSLVLWAAKSGALEKAWEVLSGHQISLEGEPVPATHSKLSEHQKEWIQHQAPQKQMEALLEAAINHDLGATDMIAQLVEGWRGSLHNTQKYQTLEMTALYSNDLRVRAAAIEINLAVYEVPKTSAEIDTRV